MQWTLSMWVRKFAFWLNAFPQILHTKGLSWVWTKLCLFKSAWRLVLYSHKLQENLKFFRQWVWECFLKSFGQLLLYSQKLHLKLNTYSFSCTFRWLKYSLSSRKDRSQWWQKRRFSWPRIKLIYFKYWVQFK